MCIGNTSFIKILPSCGVVQATCPSLIKQKNKENQNTTKHFKESTNCVFSASDSVVSLISVGMCASGFTRYSSCLPSGSIISPTPSVVLPHSCWRQKND